MTPLLAFRVWSLIQRTLSLAGLVLLSPLLLAVAILIRIDSNGPAIYRGLRVGQGGKSIAIHKLRTMHTESSVAPTLRITGHADPRITRVGRLLRRTRVDELPQLWDVARGALAMVGPRPEAPEFVDVGDDRWREILSVRPGITGPTQLRFLGESQILVGDDPEQIYWDVLLPQKIASDCEYVRTRSIRGDLAILAATARGALRRR